MMANNKNEKALVYFQKSLSIDPDYYGAHNNLGYLFTEMDQWDKALYHYNEALDIKPDYAEAFGGLGRVLKKQGHAKKAISCFQKGLALKPDDMAMLWFLSETLFQSGQFQEAQIHYQALLKKNPLIAPARLDLALCYEQSGSISNAHKQYTILLKQHPDFIPGLIQFSKLLAYPKDPAWRNPQKSIQLAQRACGLTKGKDPVALEVLAEAYASAGNFSKAAQTAQQALSLSRKLKESDLSKTIEKHLQDYLHQM